MSDPMGLPSDLAAPEDDGAADHLPGTEIPPLTLLDTEGHEHNLIHVPSRWLVLYAYPRTGGPDVDIPDDWDLIPGARGCTPQACAFRDHRDELAALDATVWGVSAQPAKEQSEFATRMHITFPLLNDSALKLAERPMRLPTFEHQSMVLYKRLTLVAEHGTIRKVFYPVFPPHRNAEEVVKYLEDVTRPS